MPFLPPGGQVLTPSPSGGALVLTPFKVAQGQYLVGRVRVVSPEPSHLWLAHRQGAEDWRRDPFPLKQGGNEVYFHLPLTNVTGQVALLPDDKRVVLAGVALRSVPINTGRK